jgi:hypothetical protein
MLEGNALTVSRIVGVVAEKVRTEHDLEGIRLAAGHPGDSIRIHLLFQRL